MDEQRVLFLERKMETLTKQKDMLEGILKEIGERHPETHERTEYNLCFVCNTMWPCQSVINSDIERMKR